MQRLSQEVFDKLLSPAIRTEYAKVNAAFEGASIKPPAGYGCPARAEPRKCSRQAFREFAVHPERSGYFWPRAAASTRLAAILSASERD